MIIFILNIIHIQYLFKILKDSENPLSDLNHPTFSIVFIFSEAILIPSSFENIAL